VKTQREKDTVRNIDETAASRKDCVVDIQTLCFFLFFFFKKKKFTPLEDIMVNVTKENFLEVRSKTCSQK
jgi:hypothetical protein